MLDQLAQSSWWILILIGVAAGVVSGSLGVGSGIIFVPVLVAAFAVGQKSAQGTALAVMVPMALLGAVRYWHNPNIEISPAVVGLLVVGALGGVWVGTELAARLPAVWLRRAFAVFMLVVAVRMFFLTPRKSGPAAHAAGLSQVDNPKSKGSSND
jgi:uncharacterized protein